MRRFTEICELLQNFAPETIDALLSLHTLTGRDYTAAFMNKTKIRPFKLWDVGEEPKVTQQVQRDVKEFICALYGYLDQIDVNSVRYIMYQEKSAPKEGDDPFDKFKSVNPSTMPPCQRSLLNKVKRVNFAASMQKQACTCCPVTYSPVENGWCLTGEKHHLNWHDGAQVPQSLSDVLEGIGLDDQEDNDYVAASDSDDNSDNEHIF